MTPPRSAGQEPSPHQRAILEFALTGRGHGVIRATAGAGKTTVLVQVAEALPPSARLLFLAFARDAARELQARLPPHATARTIHSLGREALARHLTRQGIRLAAPDAQKYRRLARELVAARLEPVPRDPAALEEVAAYLAALADLVRLELVDAHDAGAVAALARRHDLWPPADDGEAALHGLLPEVLDRGADLARSGRVDFTDMLHLPYAQRLPLPHYDLVCVDEAQDYSSLALELTINLARSGARLLFVGDARQSIFGFAGADPGAMDRITGRTNARTLPLSVSYRCPRRHVELAQRFSPEMRAAPDAPPGTVRVIPDEELERWVAPGDLLLCRYNAPLVGVCLRLAKSGLSAFVRGHDLEGRLARLARQQLGGPGRTWSPAARLEAYLRREAARFEGVSGGGPALARVRDEVSCLTHLLRDLDGRPAADELVALVEERLAEVFRESPNAVALSSVHRAKGREADRVFLLYPELMPASHARSEQAVRGEACVQFVALTRSRRELVFVLLPTDREEAHEPIPDPPVDPAASGDRSAVERAWERVLADAKSGRRYRKRPRARASMAPAGSGLPGRRD